MSNIRIKDLTTTATSFNTDDYIALDGASGGTRKMLAATLPLTDVTFGSSGPSAKSSIAARAARQGLVFDGTATSTSVSAPAFGTSDFTIAAWITPASTGADQVIMGAASGGPGWYVKSSGKLELDKLGSFSGTQSSSAVSFSKSNLVVYTRSGTTGTHYIDAVASGTVTDSQNYTNGVSLIGTDGGVKFTGAITPLIYNRALSAAEVVALYEAGTYKAISTTGLLLAPDAAQAGGGLVWYDTSGNAANITLPASGVSWNVPTSASFSGGWSFGSGGGNVGIGLTNPTSGQLHIQGNSNAASGPNRPRIALTNQAGTAQTWTIQAWQTSGDANLSIYRTAAAGGILLAPTGGNVLIGTTTDGGQKLQVAGTASITGEITGPTLAPGINTAGHYLSAFGASTSWAMRLSTIYDANYVDQYITLNGTLTGSRATPTFTGASTGGAFIRVDGSNGSLSFGRFAGGAGASISTTLTLDSSQNATFAKKIAFTAQATGTTLIDLSSTDDGKILGYGGSTYLKMGGNFRLNAGNEGFLTVAENAIVQVASTYCKLFQPLWLSNAYVAGAPTATGYLVIKDSTGTSYKIPAVAL